MAAQFLPSGIVLDRSIGWPGLGTSVCTLGGLGSPMSLQSATCIDPSPVLLGNLAANSDG